MSKILVIQPYRMLQHAIGLALFPQHEACTTSSIPDLNEFKDIDAAIIDAASLRETDSLPGPAIRSLEKWNIPIVWIDTVDSPSMPNKGNVALIHMPIDKQTLQRALADCLGDLRRSARTGARTTPREKLSSEDVAASIKGEVIDLVEVVEEAPKSLEGNGE
jgi:hypothetical protein